jgi:transcription elongation GreA/GreB family factor
MPEDVASRKQRLRGELVALLQDSLASLEDAYRHTKEAATHEEAKPENDKDTRALEQSYLARGQALRVEDMRAAVASALATPTHAWPAVAKASLGALVTVDEDGRATTYWIASEGGGARLDGGEVQVVTPKSPLGRGLLGKAAGDDCEVAIAGRTRVLQVLEVA